MAKPRKVNLRIEYEQNGCKCGLEAELDYPLEKEKLRPIITGLDIGIMREAGEIEPGEELPSLANIFFDK